MQWIFELDAYTLMIMLNDVWQNIFTMFTSLIKCVGMLKLTN